jgi:hypothetical protein
MSCISLCTMSLSCFGRKEVRMEFPVFLYYECLSIGENSAPNGRLSSESWTVMTMRRIFRGKCYPYFSRSCWRIPRKYPSECWVSHARSTYVQNRNQKRYVFIQLTLLIFLGGGGGDWVHLVWYVSQPWMMDDNECGADGGMIMSVDQTMEWLAVETDVLGETLLQCHFAYHKSDMISPGLEPGPPRWESSD